MKIVSLFFQVVLSVILVGFSIYFLTGYDSAFEADQSCHSYLFNLPDQSGRLGCDHDTETHQWILYETKENSEPAKLSKNIGISFYSLIF